jgi:hypothetical protein
VLAVGQTLGDNALEVGVDQGRYSAHPSPTTLLVSAIQLSAPDPRQRRLALLKAAAVAGPPTAGTKLPAWEVPKRNPRARRRGSRRPGRRNFQNWLPIATMPQALTSPPRGQGGCRRPAAAGGDSSDGGIVSARARAAQVVPETLQTRRPSDTYATALSISGLASRFICDSSSPGMSTARARRRTAGQKVDTPMPRKGALDGDARLNLNLEVHDLEADLLEVGPARSWQAGDRIRWAWCRNHRNRWRAPSLGRRPSRTRSAR